MSKKFDLMFIYSTSNISHLNIEIPDCRTIKEVRTWLNQSHRFIDIGSHLHNLNVVEAIRITLSEYTPTKRTSSTESKQAVNND